MTAILEKGGGAFEGIKLLLCENPLPPLDEAIEAARAELARSNYYTEAHSAPLRRMVARQLDVPERLIHVNALFPEIARRWTETRLLPEHGFVFDLFELTVPAGTTLVVIVNPNNPNGGTFDMSALPDLLTRHPQTSFLVDEAFVGLGGSSVVRLVPRYPNLLVTRTFSKAHSLAGFRVGYAILPEALADDLNANNDAYPLARSSQAAALATLQHEGKIRERASRLRRWAAELAADLGALGVRTFPSETDFFLADFAPHSAAEIAARLEEQKILVKPLDDVRLGPGYMRVTTALPEDNARFVAALREIL
jgi:histidinol-phosphate aminotransferase